MKLHSFLLTLIAGAGTFAAVAPGAMGQSGNIGNSSSGTGSAASCSAASGLVAAQPANESAQVKATLDQFATALASRDMGQLQAAGIESATVKRFQKFFKDNPNAKVTDSCPNSTLFLAEDAAIWNCMESTTLVAQGKAPAFEHAIQFTFAKKNGMWAISDRR